jgi:hypothetical protein
MYSWHSMDSVCALPCTTSACSSGWATNHAYQVTTLDILSLQSHACPDMPQLKATQTSLHLTANQVRSHAQARYRRHAQIRPSVVRADVDWWTTARIGPNRGSSLGCFVYTQSKSTRPSVNVIRHASITPLGQAIVGERAGDFTLCTSSNASIARLLTLVQIPGRKHVPRRKFPEHSFCSFLFHRSLAYAVIVIQHSPLLFDTCASMQS